VFHRNRLALIFTAITPVVIGVAALFSSILLIGLYGYNYRWAYVLDTPVNLAAVTIITIAGLIIGAV
jgi:hypothetical protein